MPTMMCPHCNYLIVDPSKPCPSCGAEIPAPATPPPSMKPRAHPEAEFEETPNPEIATPSPARKSFSADNNNLILGGIGAIVLMLAVIAWLLFSNSPEQVAKRTIRNLEAIEAQAQSGFDDIYSSMRAIRAACLMFGAENIDNPKALKNISFSDISKYLDDPKQIYQTWNLSFEHDTRGTMLVYNLKDTDMGVKQKLEELSLRAPSVLTGSASGAPFRASMKFIYCLVLNPYYFQK